MKPMRRQAKFTVLIVGEGDAEVALLRHLKAIYVQRGSGIAVTIKNANGKGAGHVIDVTRRQAQIAAFDQKAALFDTDTDWADRVKKSAREAKVVVLPCEPCVEAVLLSVHGHAVHGKGTDQMKRDFERHFGHPAHQQQVYGNHFPQERLCATAPAPIPTIIALMTTIKKIAA